MKNLDWCLLNSRAHGLYMIQSRNVPVPPLKVCSILMIDIYDVKTRRGLAIV
jgi:hypothetical protein